MLRIERVRMILTNGFWIIIFLHQIIHKLIRLGVGRFVFVAEFPIGRVNWSLLSCVCEQHNQQINPWKSHWKQPARLSQGEGVLVNKQKHRFLGWGSWMKGRERDSRTLQSFLKKYFFDFYTKCKITFFTVCNSFKKSLKSKWTVEDSR